ncbi:hypothetical protein LSUE1_G009464 [Lachnellula suecica]|uniref:Uncharacterized protein n=1 Tax=Lachnellula suecica TaxID=602035 RepID=A0A8T9C103_9HELO|nr:hypothetical protein LSUE1_G009464 [Lachnellula suecica]
MAAISTIQAREAAHQIVKRSDNWASKESGVVAVLCIVFVVGAGLLGLVITRFISKKKAERAAKSEV